MLLSELYKIMVNKVTFVGLRGVDSSNRLPWIRPCFMQASFYQYFQRNDRSFSQGINLAGDPAAMDISRWGKMGRLIWWKLGQRTKNF